MTAARRRDEILQALAGASGPVSAAALAARLGVSRQYFKKCAGNQKMKYAARHVS